MEKDIAELIGEISKVATLINMQGKHHVFVSDRGHIKELDVTLHLGGWKRNEDASLSEKISYDKNWNFENSVKNLRKIRDTLHKIYKNGKINMENCNYEIEEIKHYKFC